MIRSLTVFFVFSGLSLTILAQHSRRHQDVFPKFGNFQRRGWVVGPSVTYMMPPIKNPTQRVYLPGGTAYDIKYNPLGRVGYGLELGRFHVMDRSRLISHIELNAGFKMLRGQERFEASLDKETNPSGISVLNGMGSFSHTYATLRFSIASIQQFSSSSFLQNSFGINADYRLASVSDYSDQGLPIELADPTNFLFQVNYSLGFGFKVSGNLIVVPSVETPILNIYEYNDLKSTLSILNTPYRPLVFRVNVMVCDKKADRKCPERKTKRKTIERLFK
ncbi:MAG: hypothetical protein MK086_08760 [Flavobacteriales bacterium]|nr:hypothetical protein [Flavobacteriales bacterium]